MDWIEITSEYAGLFFRVLGGGSEYFGVKQEKSAPRLIKVYEQCLGNDPWTSPIDVFPNNQWSAKTFNGGGSGHPCKIQFMVSSGEVRSANLMN